MANQKNEWDNLGRSIQEIIDNAINQKDYEAMSRSIGDLIDSAFSSGSRAFKRAADSMPKEEDWKRYGQSLGRTVGQAVNAGSDAVRQTIEQQRAAQKPRVTVEKTRAPLPALYGSANGETTKGILKTVFGSLLTVGGLTLGLVFGILALLKSVGFAAGFFVGVFMLVGGAGLLGSGIGSLARVSRYKVYLKALGEKTHITLEKLARSVGKNEKFVRKEVTKMISQGLFLEGHLDNEQKSLITSDETYAHYEQSRQAYQQRQKEEAEKKQAPAVDPKVQEVLDKGNAYVKEIRRCNDEIPGEEISAKIDRMEHIVAKIFQRAESHPEVIPDLKKLMDYYLPMTVKLLNAYADMDRQSIQGETIQKSKQEIDATLDTLNTAFEKLLDDLFQDTAMDVSSDISVLQTLLAQEGLTGSDFDITQ